MTNDSIVPEVFERLQKATAAHPAELASLYRDYLGEARQTLVQLRNALAQKDAERFRDRSHYLRGSSLIVGATVVARCCASLELTGNKAEFRDATHLLDQTSIALDAVEVELRKRFGLAGVAVAGSAA